MRALTLVLLASVTEIVIFMILAVNIKTESAHLCTSISIENVTITHQGPLNDCSKNICHFRHNCSSVDFVFSLVQSLQVPITKCMATPDLVIILEAYHIFPMKTLEHTARLQLRFWCLSHSVFLKDYKGFISCITFKKTFTKKPKEGNLFA